MRFKEHYFKEIVATPRKGIEHIYGGEEGRYSMKPKDFLDVLEYIKSQGGSIDPSYVALSEKADGFSLRFGLDEKDKFFIESSHSGPVSDEGSFRKFVISKRGETSPIAEGFEDILKKLKDNKKLQDYLQSIKTSTGIKIQTEAFYLPIAKKHETNSTLVKFIATWYSKEKLGKWATFVVINALDGEGNFVSDEKLNEIKKGLKAVSDEDIKFEDSDISEFGRLDMTNEINKIQNFINSIEKEQGRKLDEILADRKKSGSEAKKKVKAQMLDFQKEFAKKLGNIVKGGKFGEYEGLVFKLANGVLFKVVTDRFKEAKKAFNVEFKKQKEEE